MQFTTTLLAAMAMTSTASATILARQRDCQALYTQCISSGRAEVACQCDLATCSGEDNARTREYCASATASLAAPSQTLAPTKSSSSASIIVGTPGSQPSGQAPITAAEGSLALGQTCSDSRQCANDAQCWGSTAFTIRSCGNFNAACEKDSQCAFNTCNDGLCNGFKPTASLSSVVVSTTLATKASSTASAEGKACRVHTVYV